MRISKSFRSQISAALPLSPFSITLLYLVLGSVWMLISDQALSQLVAERTSYTLVQVFKDWLYVMTTAALLFALIQRLQNQTQEAQAIKQQQRITESLSDTLAALNSNRSLDETLEFIASQATTLLGNDADAIFRFDSMRHGLMIRTARGLKPDHTAQSFIPLNNEDALSKSFAELQPVYIEDIAEYARTSALPASLRQWLDRISADFQTILVVPLVIKGKAYGGLALFYHHMQTFAANRIELAVLFSDQAALAIENARLQAEIEKSAALAERNRIARDLHDAVTQTLFSAALIAEVLPATWQIDPIEGQRRLQELGELTRGALAEMRTLLLELRPAALLEIPFSDLLHQLADAVQGRNRIPVEVSTEPQVDIILSDEAKIAFYRIIQEALNNVMKHAGATEVRITAAIHDARLVLRISDNGRGFDPARVPASHFGLQNMRERAESLNARFRLEAHPGQGTDLSVEWPFQAERGATHGG